MPTGQSSLSIKYIGRLRGGELMRSIRQREEENTRIYFYQKLYIFSLLGENEGNAELWYHCYFHKLLKKLYDYDKRHKSGNIQLLYVFLRCERNATKAAAELNMHRNNVTYHIRPDSGDCSAWTWRIPRRATCLWSRTRFSSSTASTRGRRE